MPEKQPAQDEPTYPCRVCGRKFIKSSLVKHEPACKKLTKMQRKIFDSGKQRATGTEIPLAHIKKAQKEREKVAVAGGFFPRPKTHWRERHEEFINAVSASRQVEHALKTGAPLPPPPKTSMNSVYRNLDPADCMTIYGFQKSDSPQFSQKPSSSQTQNGLLKKSHYVQCDFCGRNFNRHAAERHIPFCEEQNKRRGTTAKPQTRSASLSRATRRSSDQPPTTSSTKRSSRENSVSRGAPGSRRSSQDRPPATGKSSRQNANSATLAPRTSQLPTPVKRSSSASKVPPTAQTTRGSQAKAPAPPPSRYDRNGYNRAPKTAASTYERAPRTSASIYERSPKTAASTYERAPKTSASTYERAPKTSASIYERSPKTAASTYDRAPKTAMSTYERAPKTASSPKTPMPKSRGQTSQKRSLDTAATRRSSRSSSRKRN